MCRYDTVQEVLQHTCKFQLEIANNKKVITKKRLTNLYEMNSSLYFANGNSNIINSIHCIFSKRSHNYACTCLVSDKKKTFYGIVILPNINIGSF